MTNDIYGIEKWGKGFFKILENGNLGLLNPLKKQSKPIDLTKIVKKLNQKLSPPYIIRVADYLEFMIKEINENSNIQIITNNKNEQEILDLLEELIKDHTEQTNLKKMESLEQKLINKLDENSYSELIKLKSQLNRD